MHLGSYSIPRVVKIPVRTLRANNTSKNKHDNATHIEHDDSLGWCQLQVTDAAPVFDGLLDR